MVRGVVAAAVLVGGVVVTGPDVVVTDPDGVEPDEVLVALDVLETITVEREHPDGYDRDLFGGGWGDADGDGCNTRAEVLIDRSLATVELDDEARCRVVAGEWWSAYDDVTVTDASDIEIDHVVALKEAWDSGAWAWSDELRWEFNNDLADPRTLRPVTPSANRSKGDADPSNWIPDNEAFICEYLSDWVAIKARWELSMDESEFGRIRNLLRDRCPDQSLAMWPPMPDIAPPVLPLEAAVEACADAATASEVAVLDGGLAVLVEGGDAFEVFACFADELGLPQWPYELMVRTTEADGVVEFEVGGYRVIWSYHDDRGPLVIVADARAG